MAERKGGQAIGPAARTGRQAQRWEGLAVLNARLAGVHTGNRCRSGIEGQASGLGDLADPIGI
jgi:hypothetical protein